MKRRSMPSANQHTATFGLSVVYTPLTSNALRVGTRDVVGEKTLSPRTTAALPGSDPAVRSTGMSHAAQEG
jgi:hypothetical protein